MIITSQKKTLSVEDQTKKLDIEIEQLDALEIKVIEERENTSIRTKELESEISSLKKSIELKENEVDSLKNKDLQHTTTIGVALADIEKKRTEIEAKMVELDSREKEISKVEIEAREKIQADQEEINKQSIEVQKGITKNKETENQLALQFARLEEFKSRLLLIGKKRNGGVEVPLSE